MMEVVQSNQVAGWFPWGMVTTQGWSLLLVGWELSIGYSRISLEEWKPLWLSP